MDLKSREKSKWYRDSKTELGSSLTKCSITPLILGWVGVFPP